MAGRRPFAELTEKMTPEARERIGSKVLLLEEAMTMAELRRAMQLSQEQIAAELQVSQGSVAKLEKRSDMLVGTLRRFIRAMGGELEITARFPDHSVTIETFSGLGRNAQEKTADETNSANAKEQVVSA
jgi:transcriptional regulator with XRE-family HTH domain